METNQSNGFLHDLGTMLATAVQQGLQSHGVSTKSDLRALETRLEQRCEKTEAIVEELRDRVKDLSAHSKYIDFDKSVKDAPTF